MALRPGESDKVDRVLTTQPDVTIFLRPIAAPAALGLAGFAGSTFITASYIASWWGNSESPLIFFPYVLMWGGVGQFIAGLYGFAARDVLVTVIHTLWGAFWIAIGILYLLVATGALPSHSVHTHFPELASWLVVQAAFTLVGAVAATQRDLILATVLSLLAVGCIIAFPSLYAPEHSANIGIKVAAYFWILSSFFAWWRVTVYLMEEAFGHSAQRFFPLFRSPREKSSALVVPGLGEPGVKRGMPGVT